jgi:glycyl-tRNA synthetase beta chain
MASFLLEVGTEELPAAFVAGAIAQWRTTLPGALAEQFLQPSGWSVYGTPRRLAVLLEGLPERQDNREEEIKGPPASAAFRDGKPTPAAEGFARKQGVALAALEVRPTDKGEFVFVKKTIPGRATAAILTELVPGWIQGLEGKRFMRWGDGDLKFSRPIRWLVMLWDGAVLPLELANGSEVIQSDRLSQGHRVLSPGVVTIVRAEDYVETMRQAFVMVDSAEREATIRAQTLAAATRLGGRAEMPEALVAEVTDLVEWPTAVVGTFEESFLSLPPEVITMVMISHQRYFPIYKLDAKLGAEATDAKATLFPKFVTISNGDPAKSEVIATGNARVVRARLADGEFFYKSDCTQPLESYLAKLETVTFQEKLGSVVAKVDRLTKIAERITDQLQDQLQITDEERSHILRAAQLCKADLVSQMVFEFPELQGIMGQKYALVGGEPVAVATAISEHYLPKGAGDSLPTTRVGQVVGIADRLDTLVGIFGIGQIPKGSSDPFALRRAANAIVNITWAAELPLNLETLLRVVVADFAVGFPALVKEEAVLLGQLQEFFLQRIRTLLQEERGVDYDLVNAVLGQGQSQGEGQSQGQSQGQSGEQRDRDYTIRALQDVRDVSDRALFLQTIRDDARLDAIYETVNRSTRLAAQGDLDSICLDPAGLVEPNLFQQPSEQAFLDGLVQLLPETEAAKSSRDYGKLVASLTAIAPQVGSFFDGDQSVMVMDENPLVRQNRLNLLGLLRNHARVLADFGAIVRAGG